MSGLIRWLAEEICPMVLFWSHANLYGRIDIDMDRHIDLGLAA